MIRRVAIIAAVLALLGAGLWWWLSRPRAEEGWLGYVEGEAIYVAAPVAGTLASLDVTRGGQVAAGQRLFALDPQANAAELARLAAAVAAAKAEVADLEKARQRPEEIAIIRARQDSARAELVRARQEYDRIAVLNRQGFATNAQLDNVRAAVRAADAALAAALSEESAGRLAGRADQIRAAQDAVVQAEAALAAQRRRGQEIAPVAAAAALVEQTYFNPGEWVPANTSVVSLLEPARIKVRFFAPEDAIAGLAPGTPVRVTCDGCAPFAARVAYVSPRAEFTPPVIYSERARGKLVFLVEARPDGDPARLRPGLPVEVFGPGR